MRKDLYMGVIFSAILAAVVNFTAYALIPSFRPEFNKWHPEIGSKFDRLLGIEPETSEKSETTTADHQPASVVESK